jgi:hypothetical protein
MKLLLQKNYKDYNGWNWTLCKMLARSNLFEISEFDFPYKNIPGVRNGNWCTLELDGVRIGLDTWDTWSPTCHYLDNGLFNTILKDIKIIFKIQYYKHEYWDKTFPEKTGIKVLPWTVMPTHHFELGRISWNPYKNHKYIGSITGRNNRFGRQPWVNEAAKHKDFYTKTDYVSTDPQNDYMNILSECKWGIILKGKQRNHDGKNRREVEFSSLGMPIALSYIPTYPFEMKPNIHFYHLTNPLDLLKLRDVNPGPFSEASKQLYRDYFSPTGMSKLLIKLVKENT